MAIAKKIPTPAAEPTAVAVPSAAPVVPTAAAPVLASTKTEAPAKPKTMPVKRSTVKAPADKAAVKKPVVKKATVKASLAKAVAAAKPAKAAPAPVLKAKKPKLVRDSFTIPKAEYVVLDELKQRAAKLTRPAKKSELLRAAIKTLAALSDAAFLTALAQVPTIKTGRPMLKK